MTDLPKTLLEAVRYFSDLSVCNEYMRSIKWPGGKIVCPKCGNDSCHELATRPGKLKCNKAACQKQFSYKVGTIFEDSPLGLDKWFVAVWAIANCKNGISSHELASALGVTQKTAWFMLHRIRKAMEADKKAHQSPQRGGRRCGRESAEAKESVEEKVSVEHALESPVGIVRQISHCQRNPLLQDAVDRPHRS